MTDCDDQENYIDVQSTLTINSTIVNTIEVGLNDFLNMLISEADYR